MSVTPYLRGMRARSESATARHINERKRLRMGLRHALGMLHDIRDECGWTARNLDNAIAEASRALRGRR